MNGRTFIAGTFGVLMILPILFLAVVTASDTSTQHQDVEYQQLGEGLNEFAADVRPVSYSEEVQPILTAKCVHCHGPNSIAGSAPNGLLLDNYENVMLGSLFLPVVQPGAPENSTLILLLRSGGMPAGENAQPLPEHEIQLIERWIAQGARNN